MSLAKASAVLPETLGYNSDSERRVRQKEDVIYSDLSH